MKEAIIRSIQQQLDEKSCDCSILSRQLEQTLDDTKRQVGSQNDSSVSCPSLFTELKPNLLFGAEPGL